MRENQWNQIERIFNQAVELPGARKREFVIESCGDDPLLCNEILALLEEDNHSDYLLASPAFSHGIRLFDQRANLVPSDLQIANYEILEPLGHGGMGTVYLAEDTRLERLVALKLLPESLKADDEIVLRFQQEAKTASAISHPHVAHIYEYGQTDGHHFLAMEYVPGRTLRDILEEKPLTAACALDIAIQIADALTAAHKRGIIHRDVKPENIMLIDENFVKVLDFGLAKITAISQDEKKRLRPRRSDPNSIETIPGVILGTAAYMSPEQVRGQTVDARADIWSLGVIVYEMLAGQRPFTGATSSDIRASVLLIEPPPLAIGEGAAHADAIVRKALSKDINERYAKAEDFAFALRDLREYFESIEPCEHTSGRSGQLYSATEGGSKKSNSLIRLGLLLILLMFGVLFFSGTFLSNKLGSSPASVRQSLRVNIGGKAVRAALSRNGEHLVYTAEETGLQGLYLRYNDLQSRTSNTRILLPPDERQFVGVSFTPDGKFVYYAAKNAGESFASLYSLAVDGSSKPLKILERTESAATFSPDGGKMVFLRLGENDAYESLIIANSDGSDEQEFYTRRMPEFIPHPAQPAWSPDGKTIICAAGTYGVDQTAQAVPIAIDVQERRAVPVFKEPWSEIWQMSWLGDGSGFVMTGRRDRSADNKQLWLVSYPSGEAKRLTTDFNDYFGVSVERQKNGGDQIATMILERSSHLEKIDLSGNQTNIVNLTDAGDDGFGITRAADGIVYGSMADGNPDIWLLQSNKTRRQLTDDVHADMYPETTADGRYIVFISERSGVKSLWRMNVDGSNQILLASGAESQPFSISPDSKYVYYNSYFDGAGALWRVAIDGGQPEKMIAGKLEFPSISPDGKLIVTAESQPASGETRLVVRQMENLAQIVRTLTPISGINLTAAAPTPIKWTADGKSIVYVVTKKGVSNLWIQSLDLKKNPEQLTNFTNSRIYSFELSPDKKQIFCSRGEQSRFVTLLQIN